MDINLTPKAFSNIIENIYEASKSGHWELPLTKIRQATACYSATLCTKNYVFESKSPLNHIFHAKNYSRTNDGYFQPLSYCPLIKHSTQPKSIAVSTLLDKLSPSQFVAVPQHYRAEYYQRQKYIKENTLLNIFKPKSCGNFLTADDNLLELLSPHFSKAIELQRNLTRCETINKLSQSVFNTAEILIILCGFNGKIFFIPEATNQYLESNSHISINDGHLNLDNPFYNKRLKQLINQSINFIKQQKIMHNYLIIENKEQTNVLLVISPLNFNEYTDIPRPPYCLITIHSQDNIDWQGIKTTFELTPKEACVLKAICENQKLVDLSNELTVSYNTVRTHLQSIFRKVDVNSQVELILKTLLFKKINIT